MAIAFLYHLRARKPLATFCTRVRQPQRTASTWAGCVLLRAAAASAVLRATAVYAEARFGPLWPEKQSVREGSVHSTMQLGATVSTGPTCMAMMNLRRQTTRSASSACARVRLHPCLCVVRTCVEWSSSRGLQRSLTLRARTHGCVRAHGCGRVWACACARECMGVGACAWVWACVHVRTGARARVCACVCACMGVRMCVRAHVCARADST